MIFIYESDSLASQSSAESLGLPLTYDHERDFMNLLNSGDFVHSLLKYHSWYFSQMNIYTEIFCPNKGRIFRLKARSVVLVLHAYFQYRHNVLLQPTTMQYSTFYNS